MSKWGNRPYNVLGVQHTTRAFQIWRVRTCESAIARFSYPDLVKSALQNHIAKNIKLGADFINNL